MEPLRDVWPYNPQRHRATADLAQIDTMTGRTLLLVKNAQGKCRRCGFPMMIA